MDFSTFIGEVQNRAQLPGEGDAMTVTRITLETLSERIQPGEASDLAAQLPEEVGRHLSKVDTVESFGFEEFVARLAERGGYDEDERADAVHHARCVIDVVDDAVEGGQLRQVRDQLPDDDWHELFALADQAERPVSEDQRPE